MQAKPNVLDQVLAQRQRVTERLAQIGRVVAVMSGKGGVGKSALTANLAAALGMRRYAVGVLDADLHGSSAAAMLGAQGQRVVIGSEGARPAIGMADVRVMSMDLFMEDDNTPVAWQHPGGLAADTFVWRGTLEANVLREFLADTDWGVLDYLLIDMPPGADRFETLLRLVPELSGALVVTTLSQASQRVVQRAIKSARGAGARLLGLVENMAGLPTDEKGGSGEGFAAAMGIPYLGEVPFDPLLAHTTDTGEPFMLNYRHTPTGQAILGLVDKLEEKLR